jgi:lysophospholipase L1-like esterase
MVEGGRRSPALDGVRKAYGSLAYLTLNCIVIFVALNVIVGFAFLVRDRLKPTPAVDERVSTYRGKYADLQAYARTSAPDVAAFLDEQDAMGSIGFQYEPWVQFRNPEFQGRLLNTDARGFRKTRTPVVRSGTPLKVHVFGGSTTFGYGVPDEHTIPSYLQALLEERNPERPILVRNYGQGFYYSSQAKLLFLSLIKSGDVPDWAVFIDGGNDTSQLALKHDVPVFTPALNRLWALRRARHQARASDTHDWLPLVRLANGIGHRLWPPTKEAAAAVASDHYLSIKSDKHLSRDEIEDIVNYIVGRYRLNMRIRRALCQEFGVRCLFVWQPHPAYKYDRALHRSYPFPGSVPGHWPGVYSRMEATKERDFLNLAHLVQHETGKVYVDDVHYNETLNERIADHIARTMHGG